MPITLQNDIIFGSGEGFFGRSGSAPSTAVLSDGRIAVAWNELQYPGDGTVVLDFDVWTRIINPDGSPATEASIVNDTRVGMHSVPKVTALSDGGYAVNWEVMVNSTVEGTTRTVYEYDSLVRSYTASGAPEGAAVKASQDLEGYDPSVYNSMLYSNIENANVMALAGGGAVLVYQYRADANDGNDGGTYARSIGNDGQTLGTPVRLWDNNLFTMEMAQLSSGDIVSIAYEGDLSGYSMRLSGADLTSAPSNVGGAAGPVVLSHDPQPDQNGGGYGSAMRLIALPDGGFAVLYAYNEQLGGDDDESLRLDRFDAGGALQSTVSIPVADDAIQTPNSLPYQMLSIPGGRILVAWTEAVNYGDTDIKGVIVNADGSLESAPATLNPNTTGLQAIGDMVVLDNGEVFMAITDASGTLVGGTADNLHGLFLGLPDAPAEPGMTRTGTDGNDSLVGGSGNDMLDGAGGNDTLRGMDGTDTLIGGEGDDLIFGGNSADDLRDVVYGGTGNDSIEGGYGNDELRGDAGNDTVAGGFGADTVIGGDGDDQLTGSAWGDVIFGGNGADFINGGFGFDRVNGGTGADRFFHLGVADHGSDWVQDYSAADGDVLVFGQPATREQFQVNFTETASAGEAGVEEAFVIYRPTGQIMWALVDGAAQESLNIVIAGTEYDLLG